MSCGGKMVVTKIIPNCFRKSSRAPPRNIVGSMKDLKKCITVV